MPRYDFHMHTWHSYDCLMPPAAIIRAAQHQGLSGIAITDHEAFAGALAVQAAAPQGFLVIAGMEIYTDVGDIVCLGLEREISDRDASSVIAEVHRQGGVAFLPHPLQGHPAIPDAILDAVDGYEVLNARGGTFSTDERRGQSRWERLRGKAKLANSDAHFPGDIGRAWTEIDGPATLENVLAAIRAGRTTTGGGRSTTASYYASQLVKMVKTRDPAMLLRLGRKAVRRILRGRPGSGGASAHNG